MKKLITLVLISSLLLTGCGQPAHLPTGPNGERTFYPTYGLFNEDTSKSEKVCYEISIGNVIWSIITIEIIIVPIYLIGFSLFNPVSAKSKNGCGIDSR